MKGKVENEFHRFSRNFHMKKSLHCCYCLAVPYFQGYAVKAKGSILHFQPSLTD